MKIVLAKPFNDESIVEPYLVQHNSKKTETAFEKAFEKYLNDADAMEYEDLPTFDW